MSDLKPRTNKAGDASKDGSLQSPGLSVVADTPPTTPPMTPRSYGLAPMSPLSPQATARLETRQRSYASAAVAVLFFAGLLALLFRNMNLARKQQLSGMCATNTVQFRVLSWLYGGVTLICTAVMMEYYARYAHRVLWHGPALWWAHESHHSKIKGAFELNDALGIGNAVPAAGLMAFASASAPAYGRVWLLGATIGVSIFGCSYCIVHDGIHHRRFYTGLLQHVEALRRIADAHAVHHAEKAMGPPFGLFLGPYELECLDKGLEPQGMPLWLCVGLLSTTVVGIFSLITHC